ncbi:WD40-repeat-containing domain protein [Crucibulum laeve]|uniref:WD40-repeat-containing domain protein n=1 Tax=Crucibulum laeve TaxID=68775 RepID=A0A5C3LU92_9AGAR|nr:WD40-repeat-containing domain protein [Crucibulum laeve]
MTEHQSLLTSTTPSALVPARVVIRHLQLRDLIICPLEKGTVNYVQGNTIVEHNLNAPGSSPRTLAELTFLPNTLSSMPIGNDILLAAGGQEAEIHLSYHTPRSAGSSSLIWQYEHQIDGSINNSVLLTHSNESSAELRLMISNNDCTVKFFDVPSRAESHSEMIIKEVGKLQLDTPVNHSSLSPDGNSLLSVGDSSKVYLHQLRGSSQLTFQPISILTLPSPNSSPFSTCLTASFSTSFSSDGSKFAVASQDGLVAVWDVRSTHPIQVFHTYNSYLPTAMTKGNGTASGWLSTDPWEWTRGAAKTPGWSVRSVKFSPTGQGRGKEVLAFTEHTSLLHIVDARTLDAGEGVQVMRPGSNDSTDLDLAGLCFDPSGEYVYVASTEGVAEWAVSIADF